MKKNLIIIGLGFLLITLVGCDKSPNVLSEEKSAELSEQYYFPEGTSWSLYENEEYGFQFYYVSELAYIYDWGPPLHSLDDSPTQIFELDEELMIVPKYDCEYEDGECMAEVLVQPEDDPWRPKFVFGHVENDEEIQAFISRHFSSKTSADPNPDEGCYLTGKYDENGDGIYDIEISYRGSSNSQYNHAYTCLGGVTSNFLYNSNTGTIVYFWSKIFSSEWTVNGEAINVPGPYGFSF